MPDFIPGQLVLSTSSCISIGCLMWQDGETEVTLGAGNEVDPGRTPVFDDFLDAPSRSIVVRSIDRDKIFQTEVSVSPTRIRIWVNCLRDPDKIIIGCG